MEDKEELRAKRRIAAVAVMLGLVVLIYCGLLYQYQIVEGADYLEASSRKVAQQETVEAARGTITDSQGQVLVGNRQVQQVNLDLSLMGEAEERNAILYRLIQICREEEVTWLDELPVTTEPPFQITRTETVKDEETGEERVVYTPFYIESTDEETGLTEQVNTRLGRLVEKLQESSTKSLKWTSADGTEHNITDYVKIYEDEAEAQEAAEAIVEWLCFLYGVGDTYSDTDARALAGVYYEQMLLSYEVIYEYTFAEDVDIDFISRVKEESLTGVQIETTTVRSYETSYAAHLLGITGAITPESWPTYKELNYNMNDTVGLSGIEYAFEEYLHGTPGTRTVETNTSGKVISETYLTMPEPGYTVETTLDLGLQQKVEDALAEYVPQLSGSLGAGIIALDPNSGSVLAAGSYPTFDLENYNKNYNEYSSDPLTPLLNRPFQGLYAPGSTYKMVTAVAGLEEGVITPTETIRDLGTYVYYDARPKCWYYRQYGRVHGKETVSDAIRDSCNYYFYETIVRLDQMDDREGIDILNSYAGQFGLGQKTGVEIAEYAGILAGPEFSESLGSTWYRGNMLYAAIGQSDNQFTLVQLANYVSTLINGGNRYQVHLLKSIKSYDRTEVIEEYEPAVLNTVEMSDSTVNAVKQGMREVATDTLKNYFADLEAQGITVGAKTGSAQVAGQENSNAMFVCFAPYDDPQIVLAIAVESGGSGSELAAIAADVLSYYFSADAAKEAVDGDNTFLQ